MGKKDVNIYELFKKYKKTKNIKYRNEIVDSFIYLTNSLSMRFYKRGVDLDDLQQIAAEALIKAVERFDLSKGVKFQTFAIPTIIGEIKKHYRDKASTVRLPRRIYELITKVKLGAEELKQKNGKVPNAMEISKHINEPLEDILEAFEAMKALQYKSIDAPENEYDDYYTKKQIGVEEEGFEKIENKQIYEEILSKLDENEKKLLHLRFKEDMSQIAVSKVLNVSQMTVSRWEKKVFEKARMILEELDD